MNQYADKEDQIKWAAEAASMAFQFVNVAESLHAKDFAESIKWGFTHLDATEMAEYLIAIGTMMKQDQADAQNN